MARPHRLYIKGIPIHVTMRGVDGMPVFHTDSDRLYFRAALESAARLYGLSIHAYVFMTNHVHILGTPDAPDSIARTWQCLGPKYTGYFNRLNARQGTRWQSRHNQFVVQTDHYFLACMRYVERNPLRAKMVRSAEDHPWSSYRCNAFGFPDTLVTPHPTFLALSADSARRRRAYLALFDDREDERYRDIFRKAARSSFAVGDPKFLDWAAQMTGRRLPKEDKKMGSDPSKKLGSDPSFLLGSDP